MKLLFLGDIVGRPGRNLIAARLPGLLRSLNLDLALANAENASGGIGLTVKTANELLQSGLCALTSGNHIFKHKEIRPYLDSTDRVLRPANYPQGAPGTGLSILETPAGELYALLNLLGRTFMDAVDCPFQSADSLLASLPSDLNIRILDFHAEATSEKKALAYYLDGRVSALVGTHTHVQTNDARILPAGTGYLTDLGMCGPSESILGMDSQAIIKRFVSGLPHRFSLAQGPAELQGALLDIDSSSGKTVSIGVWKSD